MIHFIFYEHALVFFGSFWKKSKHNSIPSDLLCELQTKAVKSAHSWQCVLTTICCFVILGNVDVVRSY